VLNKDEIQFSDGKIAPLDEDTKNKILERARKRNERRPKDENNVVINQTENIQNEVITSGNQNEIQKSSLSTNVTETNT